MKITLLSPLHMPGTKICSHTCKASDGNLDTECVLVRHVDMTEDHEADILEMVENIEEDGEK